MLLRSLPWSRALRAGAAAFLSTTLFVGLLISSYWAGHTNYPGHQHPEGTPEHTHTIIQVAGAAAMPVPTIVPRPEVNSLREPRPNLGRQRSLRLVHQVQARAPPVRPSPLLTPTPERPVL